MSAGCHAALAPSFNSALSNGWLANVHTCAYTWPLDYEWDPGKDAANIRKHGISLADAATALEDGRALTIPDIFPDEERFATIGMDALGRLVVVVYAWRGGTIRIISARRATARELHQCEE